MNERLRHLRTVLHLSQEGFESRIVIKSRSHISALENGSRNITDRIISDICREFGVSETWLRTGNGQMLEVVDQDQRLAALTATLMTGENSFKKEMITLLLEMDVSEWKKIEHIIRKLSPALSDDK